MIKNNSNKGFFKPYEKKGRVSKKLLDMKGKAGVYIIKKPTGKFLYIGYSAGNLYDTATRHFRSWDDPRQRRVTFSQTGNYLIKVFKSTPKRAEIWEQFLINKYKPSKNEKIMELYSESDKRIFKKHQQELEEQFGKITETPF